MTVQIITTDSGEELVVLPRREYDALLASLGDDEAEDRMTVLIAEEARRAIAAGDTLLIPGWVIEAGTAGNGRPLRGLRRLRKLRQAEVAARAGITQGYYSDIERGAKQPAADVLDRISDALALERSWLASLMRGDRAGTTPRSA
jgi:DNA-binding XRE family transcriptional regulator